jgi:hypothetical protein
MRAGQTVGWFYFRHDEETARQAKVLTRDEARRMAVNFARLPELLRSRSQLNRTARVKKRKPSPQLEGEASCYL